MEVQRWAVGNGQDGCSFSLCEKTFLVVLKAPSCPGLHVPARNGCRKHTSTYLLQTQGALIIMSMSSSDAKERGCGFSWEALSS